MEVRTLLLELSDDQLADLNDALEDYRDYFKAQAQEASMGFGLDAEYWESRANEIQGLREMLLKARGKEIT